MLQRKLSEKICVRSENMFAQTVEQRPAILFFCFCNFLARSVTQSTRCGKNKLKQKNGMHFVVIRTSSASVQLRSPCFKTPECCRMALCFFSTWFEENKKFLVHSSIGHRKGVSSKLHVSPRHWRFLREQEQRRFKPFPRTFCHNTLSSRRMNFESISLFRFFSNHFKIFLLSWKGTKCVFRCAGVASRNGKWNLNFLKLQPRKICTFISSSTLWHQRSRTFSEVLFHCAGFQFRFLTAGSKWRWRKINDLNFCLQFLWHNNKLCS